MPKLDHTKRHKALDEALNELVADFIEFSGVPAHLASVHDLLFWSKNQARGADHPNQSGKHEQ